MKISQLQHEILMLTAKKGEHWLSKREGAYMQAHRELIAAGYMLREGNRHRLTGKGIKYVTGVVNQRNGIELVKGAKHRDKRDKRTLQGRQREALQKYNIRNYN
jgi:hypothetical protein